MKKYARAILCTVLTLILLASCAASPKAFTYENMSITLTDGFHISEDESLTEQCSVAYDSRDFAVIVLNESKSGLGDLLGHPLEFDEYKDFVASGNDIDESAIKEENGLVFFEYGYTDEESGKEFHSLVCLFESEEDFWLVQFTGKKADFDKKRDSVISWAKSVTFS